LVQSFGRSKGCGSRIVVVVGERYWVSDVWAWGQNGRKKNRDKFACPVCCAAIIFLGLIYVCERSTGNRFCELVRMVLPHRSLYAPRLLEGG
jgi:hypothetical protein